MADIPVTYLSLGCIGILFFLIGIFLLISGFGIISIKEAVVPAERKTRIVGSIFCIIGSFFLIFPGNPSNQTEADFSAAANLFSEGAVTQPFIDTAEPTITKMSILSTPTAATPTSTKDLTPTKQSTVIPLCTKTPLPTDIIAAIKKIKIPEGEFMMGNDRRGNGHQDRDYNPSHQVYVSEFYMDQYEVTNSQYNVCVQAGVCNPPDSFSSTTREHYYDSEQYGNFPVVYITWSDANEFCRWRGARIPTEAEWEKAASWAGPGDLTGRFYPWGDQAPERDWVNFNSVDTTEVGSLPQNKSLLGIYDMAGNVLEWVNDNYSFDYYHFSPDRDPQGPDLLLAGKAARGGSFLSEEDWRLWTFRRFVLDPDKAYPDVGFRCASDRP